MEQVFDVDAAIATSRRGSQCAVQSCVDASMAEQSALLNTSGVPRNARGDPAERLPVVYLQSTAARSERALLSYRVVMVCGASDVRLMWLQDADTGQVYVSKSVEAGDAQPSTLVGDLREPYGGVRRGTVVVPKIFFADAGYWEGPPFVLGEEQPGGSVLLRADLSRPIDTRGRRASNSIGEEVLREYTRGTGR